MITSQSSSYFVSLPLSSLGHASGDCIGIANGIKHHPLQKYEGEESKQKIKVITHAVVQWFLSWEPWQWRILFSGLVNRFEKSQLQSLSIAVESVFHRDFLADLQDEYPMRKVRARRGTSTMQQESMECTQSSNVEMGEVSELTFRTDSNAFISKNLSALNGRPSYVSDSRSTRYSSSVSELKRLQLSEHEEVPRSSSSSRNLSPIEESSASLGPKPSPHNEKTPLLSLTPQFSNFISAARIGTAASTGSAQSVAPSLSPIEETSPENSSNGASPATASNATQNKFNQSSQIKSTLQTAPQKSKLGKNTKKSLSGDIEPVRADSAASKWTMGPPEDDEMFGFHTNFTEMSVKMKDFFPAENQKVLGKPVASRSQIGSAFMQRFDVCRNKVPGPTAKQLYKNSKFWSTEKITVEAKPQRLKEDFGKQLQKVWNWLESWRDHQIVQLLLKLLAHSDGETVKYVALCIKQNARNVSSTESTASLLPDSYWLSVFDHLSSVDIAHCGEVCRWWYCLAQTDWLWKNKCKEIGDEYGVENFLQLMEETAHEHETLDWKQAYIELHERMGRNASKFSDLRSSSKASTYSDDSDEVPHDLSDEALAQKYKDYIPYWKLHKKTRKPSFQRQVGGPTSQIRQVAIGSVQSTSASFKQDEEIVTVTEAPVDEDSPLKSQATTSPDKTQSAGGFLSMWKNITEDLKEGDMESISKRSDHCYGVPILNQLVTENEIADFARRGELFAVDHRIKGPTTGTGKFWLVNNIVKPVRKVQSLEGHNAPVMTIMCHGKRIFSGGMDQKIRMWAPTGESFGKINKPLKGGVLSMAMGEDEKCRTLYIGSWDMNVTVWDCVTRELRKALVGHTGTVTAVAVDNSYIISCSHDTTIRVWDIRNYQCLRVLRHHNGAVQCMSYHDKVIITGGADRLIHMSNPDDGELLKTLRGHMSPVTAIVRQHKLIASADREGMIMLWSAEGGSEPVESIQAHEKQINDVAISGGRFFTASRDMLVKEWELVTMRCVRILQGHVNEVTGVRCTARYLVTGSKDSSVRLWWWGSEDELMEQRLR
ncbi:uncharacterized protein LOC101242943 isoform X2 [Ciona intestinalis]